MKLKNESAVDSTRFFHLSEIKLPKLPIFLFYRK